MRAAVLLTMLVMLLASPPPAAARIPATLTITPPTGPPGTTFELRAAGLPPGIAVVALVHPPSGELFAASDPGRVSPAGEWRPPPWRTVPGDPVGRYAVAIAAADGATVLASGSFTVTATQAPPVQVPGPSDRSHG
jgi:hypothetical protein